MNTRPFPRMLLSYSFETGHSLRKSRERILCAQLLNDLLDIKVFSIARLDVPQDKLADVSNAFLITRCHCVVSPSPETRCRQWIWVIHHQRRVLAILIDTTVNCIVGLRVLFKERNLPEELQLAEGINLRLVNSRRERH